jgi:hypothetical protein
MHIQTSFSTTLRFSTIHWHTVIAARLLALSLALGACSSDGEKLPSTETPQAYIDGLAGTVLVSGAGELIDLPEVDPSLSVSGASSGSVVSIQAGSVITASLVFNAPNANVVAAGIRFSNDSQILTVPMPNMVGQTAGSLSFQLQFPADFCSNLGSICHSIQCYEYAITSDGKVSAANIVDMAAACGECTDSSCIGLLPECGEASFPTTCSAADGSLLGPGETLYELAGQGSALALGDDALYLLADQLVKMPIEPGGTPEVLVADVPNSEDIVKLADQLFFGDSRNQLFQIGEGGGELVELGELGANLATDGEFVYAAYKEFLCDPEDADQYGIRKLNANGAVTVLDPSVACIGALTVGGGHVYWLSEVTDDEELYRIPVNGGAPEKMPLEVAGWYHLDWTDGYLVGSEITGNRRGRPDQPTHESLGLSLDGTGSDGQSVFLTRLSSESCIVQVRGGAEAVNLASFDPEHMNVEAMVGNTEYVYSAVLLTDQFLIEPTNPVTRIMRIPRP